MLNWVFLKKFILAGSIAGLSATPLILISKYSAWGSSQYFSELKLRKGAYSRKFADKFGFDEFTHEIFNVDEMKTPVEGVFARDIVGNYLRRTNSSYLRNKYAEFASKEASDFQRELYDLSYRYPTGKPAINRILDENGGTREDMIRRKLNSSSYDFLKKEILEFNQNNFTLNRHYNPNNSNTSFIRGWHFFSKSELEDNKNWDKIGFYPLVTNNVINNPSLEHFQRDKFEFINWAYKKWFEEVQPFYVWMSLWKYKENATRAELERVWNKSLGEHFPSKASYEFPYFDASKGNKLSTASKFEKFFESVVKTSEENPKKDLYVPNLYTDDSSTGLYMEGSNMYNGNWYVKFAAAANYKYQKVLFSQGRNQYINEKQKTDPVNSYQEKLFNLFSTSSKSRALKVDKDNIFNQGNQEKYSDAVEIKDSPWIFIRNQAGIHAIAVDSEGAKRISGNNRKLEDVFNHFNYRTLQAKEKKNFSLSETVAVDYTKPINSFKDYISKHFDRLLVRYTISEDSKNNNLFRTYNTNTSDKYKNLFSEWEELMRIKERYQRSIQLREALIKEYAKSEWEADTSLGFKNVPKKLGISSPNPYEMRLKKSGDNEGDYLFPELEKIYDVYFGNNKSSKELVKEFKEKQSKFQQTLQNTFGTLELNTKVSSPLQSDRIFLNNFFVNEIIDAFFDNEKSFRTLLLKSSLKDEYLGKSFIGSKGSYVDTKEKKTLLINNNPEDESAKDEKDFLDSLDSDENQEKRKKLMKDIETYVNKFYYGKYFLKNIDNNIWDVLKYGGEKIDSKQISKPLKEASKEAFENGYFLNVNGLKDKHLKFLTTLTYLTKDNFSHFLSLMKAAVTPKTDAYFLWEKLNKKAGGEVVTSNKNPLLNPWLKSDTGDFSKKIKDFDGYLRTYFSGYAKKGKVGKDLDENGYQHNSFYKGFLVLSSSQSWIQNLVSDPNKFVSDSLYKYGSDGKDGIKGVDEYVQSIQNDSDLNDVIERIKSISSSNKEGSEILNLFNSNVAYVKKSNGDNSTVYRVLTLQEKKNFVSAILNNVEIQKTLQDGVWDQEQYKKIFKMDPNGWNALTDKHTKCETGTSKGTCGKFENLNHKQKKGKIAEDYFVTQVNHNTFTSFDKFKDFVNKNLTKELFWAWIIDLAQNESIQEMAVRNLEETTLKVEAYDQKFKDSASYRYAR